MIKTFITAESRAKYSQRIQRSRVVIGLGDEPVTVKDIPFTDLQFSANGSMTWTVQSTDLIFMTYMQISTKVAMLWFRLQGTTIGGVVNTTLVMTLPGYIPLAKTAGSINANRGVVGASGTTAEFITASVDGATRTISFQRAQAQGTNWQLSTDAQTIEGFFCWPLA